MVITPANILEQQYEEFTDGLVFTQLERGIARFDLLLISLPGIYPSFLLASLQRLVAAGEISQHLFVDILGQAQQKQNAHNNIEQHQHRIILPVQHPLDFEWRFSDKATANLLERVTTLTTSEQSVALLGSPSILRMAFEIDYPRSMILLDANPIVLESLAKVAPKETIILCDISKDEPPEISAGTVIVDPPWYEEHIRSFLWAACKICMPGGYLLVSLPPAGTRPGISQELDNILQWAQDELGLSLLSLERAVLPYATPLFERNALRAEGIYTVPFEWRRGDLALFSSSGPPQTPRPEIPLALATSVLGNEWNEECLWGVRIRIRKQNGESSDFKDPYLESIVAGDVLPSVSRRDERRKLADVWTSGNRIFACSGRKILRSLIQSLATGQSPIQEISLNLERSLSADELHLVSQATQRIIDIARLERDEKFLYDEDSNDARMALTSII